MQMSPHFSFHSNRRKIRMFEQQFHEVQLSSDVCVCITSKNTINRSTNGP